VNAVIAIVVAVVVVVTMAIDHWFGTESEPGESAPVDPGAFFIATGLAFVLTALLFWFVVKPAPPEKAAKRGIICSALAVVTVPLLFLAVPFPFAGAGLALGLAGRGRLATAASVMGALVLAVGLIAYVVTAL
jgi:hypothetical protein